MPELIGPFTQLLTMSGLPLGGPITDQQLQIIEAGAILVEDGLITDIGRFEDLKSSTSRVHLIEYPTVAVPGLIDSHTHICYAGNRAGDYAKRVAGQSYLEIASSGGGILDTVAKTRAASKSELIDLTLERTKQLLKLGITTCEVKSGYGLTVGDELRLLDVIAEVGKLQPVALIPTCLAAHTKPPEFSDNSAYLQTLILELLPALKARGQCHRIDIFVDQTAFSVPEARTYLTAAKEMGFQVCVHADQFKRGGAVLAAELNAVSADHLENSNESDMNALLNAGVVAVALPGASLGLGIAQPPARQMLDLGLMVAIASDWNPGSAPMGNLIAAAAILGAAEKLTIAEVLAGITVRAARALNLNDRGVLQIGKRADIAVFPCNDYREILYRQGSMTTSKVFIEGHAC